MNAGRGSLPPRHLQITAVPWYCSQVASKTTHAPLPEFKYHPSPLTTGSIEKSDGVCRSCEQARGYIYTGPCYAEEELDNDLCPWCIADGSAHEKFSVEFVDSAGIGGHDGRWDKVPRSVIEEVAFRTPGFSGLQQEQWFTHCGDAAEFIQKVEMDGAGVKYIFRCRHCGKQGGYQDQD